MVILSTEEEVEVEVQVQEEENGFRKDQMDRPNGGFGRGYSQSNVVRTQQTSTERPEPDQTGRRLVYTHANVERREDTERHETSQAPPPDVPPPMEERLFTNWSSIDSPRERVTQCRPIHKEC